VQALPYILPFFQSVNPDLREAAVVTLRYLNQVDRCQPALDLLTDPAETVRREVVLTLGHLRDKGIAQRLSQTPFGRCRLAGAPQRSQGDRPSYNP
jgi:HEAT repeat protein